MAEIEKYDRLEAERERKMRNTLALKKRMEEIAKENQEVKQSLQSEIDKNSKDLADTEAKIKESKEAINKIETKSQVSKGTVKNLTPEQQQNIQKQRKQSKFNFLGGFFVSDAFNSKSSKRTSTKKKTTKSAAPASKPGVAVNASMNAA